MPDESGLQTFATDGRVQVDLNNRTLLLLKSGQYTANDANQQADMWYQEQADIIGRMTNSALLCIRAPDHGIHPCTSAFRDGKKITVFTYLAKTNITFQYYIFDNMAPSIASKLGLQSFDASGNLIYDAMDYPMKILSIVNTSQVYPAFGNPVKRVLYEAPHPNIAFGCLGGGYTLSVDDDDTETWSKYLYVQGNTVYQWDMYDPGSQAFVAVPFYGNYGFGRMSNIIVDTTNLPLNYTRP